MAEAARDVVARYLEIYTGWGVNPHCPICKTENESSLKIIPFKCDGLHVTVRRCSCEECGSTWDELHVVEGLFDRTPMMTQQQWFRFIQSGFMSCPWKCGQRVAWDAPYFEDFYSISGMCPDCSKEVNLYYKIKDIDIVSCAPDLYTPSLFEMYDAAS